MHGATNWRPPPAVVVLDDDVDMLESVHDLLARQAGCLVASSYEELLELGDRALECRVAILDINLGPGRPSGIDAYQWFRERNFAGRVAFLTGHAKGHPLVEEVSRLGNVIIIEKPATAETLLRFVEQ
jgi:FixJ family two-component response regulator